MTDWEKQLRRRVAVDKRRARELKQDIAAARLAGHTFRKIGEWAEVNHETVRNICMEISGHTRTQAELDAAPADA